MTGASGTGRAPATVDLTDSAMSAGTEEDDRSLSELLSALTTDISELMRTQLELAKVEIKEEAGRAGRAVAMGAAGAVVAVCALLLIGMTIAWALDEALPTWLSFGLVALVYAAVAAALVMAARARVAEISLPPTQTTETLQEDKEWLQQHRS